MKSSNERPSSKLLSKRNAKSLLARNAIDAATLEKEARLLQSERNSEERLFRKKKEVILQRQSRILQRQMSSVSLPEKESSPPSKGTMLSLRRSHSLITLPDIHAAQRKIERRSKKYSDTDMKGRQVNGKGFATDTCPKEDWTDLRKCRYLRFCSTNKEMLDVERLSDRL